MKIRTRLTVQFLLIGVAIMIVATSSIYIASSQYRKDDFYKNLENRANRTAQLLIEVDEIDVDLLRKIDTDNPVSLPDEKVIIFNYKNEILYSTDEQRVIRVDSLLLDRIRLNKQLRIHQEPYEVLGILYTEGYDRFVAVAAAIDFYGLKKLQNLRIILTTVFFASLILIALSGWFYAGKALEPISGVVRQVENISVSSLNLRVNEGNGTDEIAVLAKTFNKMLNRLEIAFKMQKDFISNASHELRTPLTAINGQLEVLLIKDRSSTEYKKMVESVLEDIKNLIDLSNRLLLLAQTTVETDYKNFGKIRIDEILWQSMEEIKKYNGHYNIFISMDENLSESEQMLVCGDEYLLRTAFINIIDNACKYSPPNNKVNISLSIKANMIEINFADQGIGISPNDLKHIFEPFHRGGNVKSVNGHGIGLSIVHSIILRHNGSIDINSLPNKGTQVIINLPNCKL